MEFHFEDGIIEIRHADTSSVSDVTSATNTFLSAIGFDTYGHVTSRSTGIISFNVSDNYAFSTLNIGTDSGYTWGTVNTNPIPKEKMV